MSATDNNRTKEELSKSILQTASQLFSEYGVEAVSMHQIAKCAGVGQGTLYRRYSNKADLCMGMMQDNFDQLRDEVGRYLTDAGQHSAKARLKGVIDILLQFLDKKSKMLGIIQAHQLLEHKKNDFFGSPPYKYIHSLLCGLMNEARGQELKAGVDAEFAAHTMIAVLSPHTIRHLEEQGYSSKQIYELYCAYYIDPLFQAK